MNDVERLDRILGTAFGDQYIVLAPELPDRSSVWWDKPQERAGIRMYVLHHSATSSDFPAHRIYNSHLRRFGGIGYHFLVYCYRWKDGVFQSVLRTRDPCRWGAHVKGQNQNKLGVCWVGDYVESPPSDVLGAFSKVFLSLINGLDQWVGHQAEVSAHRFLDATACPGGPWVEPFVESMNAREDDHTERWIREGRQQMYDEIMQAMEGLAP